MVAAVSTQKPTRDPLMHWLRGATAINEKELCGVLRYAVQLKTGCKLKQLPCAITITEQLTRQRYSNSLHTCPSTVLDSYSPAARYSYSHTVLAS